MTWWQAALLGLIQGLTEFLPVSSSGHLVLAEYLLGLDEGLTQDVTFEVFVHFGTALSILVVYRKQVWDLITSAVSALVRPSGIPDAYRQNDDFRVVVFVLLTMIPTGLAYVLFEDFFESAFSDPRLVSAMLLVTGTLLLLTRLRRNPNGSLSFVKALVIGVAQSLALIPGISRSGSTICTALYLNVDRQKAADFSFLMVLPVILGATLLKTLEMLEVESGTGVVSLLLGTVVAFLSGVVAIRMVIRFVVRGNLQYFAFYCFAVGLIGLILIRP